eukprot:1465765-Pyramimonas_sp.AAC.1
MRRIDQIMLANSKSALVEAWVGTVLQACITLPAYLPARAYPWGSSMNRIEAHAAISSSAHLAE